LVNGLDVLPRKGLLGGYDFAGLAGYFHGNPVARIAGFAGDILKIPVIGKV
jgi:hypothetical protein